MGIFFESRWGIRKGVYEWFRRSGCVLTFAVIAATGVAQTAVTPANIGRPMPVLAEYRIAPGDELSITFPYNAELNHDGPVGPDGRFTLPLLGSMALAGETIPDATRMISNALREGGIVANAYPSITIRRYGMSVYVGGQVHQPGVVPLAAGMDAVQAVIAAGGTLDTAKVRRIAIIRRTADNHASIQYVNIRGYTHAQENAPTILLEPRDVVFVPKSNIAEVNTWIDNYINKTVPFGRNLTYNTGNYAPTPATAVTK